MTTTDEERLAAIRALLPEALRHLDLRVMADDVVFLLSLVDRLKAERAAVSLILGELHIDCDALRAQVETLTRERDDAQADYRHVLPDALHHRQECDRLRAQVAKLEAVEKAARLGGWDHGVSCPARIRRAAQRPGECDCGYRELEEALAALDEGEVGT